MKAIVFSRHFPLGSKEPGYVESTYTSKAVEDVATHDLVAWEEETMIERKDFVRISKRCGVTTIKVEGYINFAWLEKAIAHYKEIEGLV